MIKIKAANERNSRAIAKFSNAEIGYFGLKLIVHVLIRGSLGLRYQKGGETETDGIADNNEIDQLGGDLELGYKFNNSWQAFVTYGEVLAENDGSESDMWRMRLIYLF
jgi:hypothetical protein